MRRSFPILIVLLATVAACGRVPDTGAPETKSGSPTTADTADEAAAPAEMNATPGQASRGAGPNVRPEAAPGVAFNYRYSFRLEADRVAQAQQEHQRLCERFGVSRCQITGMSYRAANDEDIEAMLALRVDPAIAGQLGRESVQAVLNAEGSLADSEITGTEVGPSIEASGRTLAEMTQRLQALEARIRQAPDADKGTLRAEADALRQQISDLRANREGQQRALAMTPMLFRYGSGDLAPGPARPPTLREALKDTGDDFLDSLTFLLIVLVRLLPWATAALIGWGLFRVVRRRLAPRPAAGEPEPLGI